MKAKHWLLIATLCCIQFFLVQIYNGFQFGWSNSPSDIMTIVSMLLYLVGFPFSGIAALLDYKFGKEG